MPTTSIARKRVKGPWRCKPECQGDWNESANQQQYRRAQPYAGRMEAAYPMPNYRASVRRRSCLSVPRLRLRSEGRFIATIGRKLLIVAHSGAPLTGPRSSKSPAAATISRVSRRRWHVCFWHKADILVSDAYLSATDRQAQLLIETGATEPFEIVLSLAVVFDRHLLRDPGKRNVYRAEARQGSLAVQA